MVNNIMIQMPETTASVPVKDRRNVFCSVLGQDPVQHRCHCQFGSRERRNTTQEADSVEHDGQFQIGRRQGLGMLPKAHEDGGGGHAAVGEAHHH